MFLALVFLMTFSTFTYSEVVQSIQVDFEREWKERGRQEVIKGTFYYQASGRTVVWVREPISQWMIGEEDQLILYYPHDRQAFRFTSQPPSYFPIFEAFTGALKEDYGLTNMGYSLANHQIKGDTLTTRWSPSRQVSERLGDFTLVYVSDKIGYAELKRADGSIMSRSFYGNHIKHGAHHFPLQISTTRYGDADSSYERITYSNPQFNICLPEAVENLTVPSDIEIEEITW